jgi:hypothetical protein
VDAVVSRRVRVDRRVERPRGRDHAQPRQPLTNPGVVNSPNSTQGSRSVNGSGRELLSAGRGVHLGGIWRATLHAPSVRGLAGEGAASREIASAIAEEVVPDSLKHDPLLVPRCLI